MRRSAIVLFFAGMLWLGATALAGQPSEKLSASVLAARIDEHIAAKYQAHNALPAPLADDAERVRRLYLDLTGRIPDILAARDFADNPGKDKWPKLIDRLLASERYPIHFANVWRGWVLPDAGEQSESLLPSFEMWLRDQLRSNASYSSIVRAMVAGQGGSANGTDVLVRASQSKPEALAAITSRLFLGVKLECAQCHNHPFARWQRKQFWEFAAFYSRLSVPGRTFFASNADTTGAGSIAGEIKIPDTDKTVKAHFLDGNAPDIKAIAGKSDYRAVLADWMVANDNPWFARAVVNRYWEYFMGTGLVEPVDEESSDNPPSHPELLTLLAEQFAEHDFDLKYLIRAITSSRAYQLSSKQTHASQADRRLFARMKVRGLSPEQLFDSLALATGQKGDDAFNRYYDRVPDIVTPRADFLRRFPSQGKRSEQQVSILQALYLLNGKLVSDATSLEHNKNLEIIARAATVPATRRIEQLYLITLARTPARAERDRLVKYVEKGGPSGDPGLALCDVFWALLNSSEFCVNH
jgi:hypothetical protein